MKTRRICFSGERQIVFEETELADKPGPDEILCRTLMTAISPGTETAIYTRTHIGFQEQNHPNAHYPFYPGYLNIARITAVGSAVAEFKPGQLVFSNRGHCSAFLADSGTSLIPLPEDANPEHAALVGMAGISSTAGFMSPASPGQTVAVLGQGIVGNLAAQIYRNTGARSVGVDLAAARLDIARQCGLPTFLSTVGDDWIPGFHKQFGEPQVVVEATGSPAVIETGLKLSAAMGRVVLLGSPRGVSTLDTYKLIHCRGVSLVGAHSELLPERKHVLRDRLAEIVDGRLKIGPMITHRLPYTDVGRAYELYAAGDPGIMAVILNWQNG